MRRQLLGRLPFAPFLTVAAILAATPSTQAAISWDGGGATSWWFDPENWSQSSFGHLPPSQDSAGSVVRTDAQINSSPAGEGVVYDPVNDPFFASAAARTYPTGSAATAFVGRDYGPESIYRLYISRNATNKNTLTIKSGDLVIDSTTIIGRSGSTATVANEGRVNQLGGRLRLPVNNLDIGETETIGGVSTWGSGVYNYQGGSLEVALEGGTGIRLGHGNSGANRGPSGVNRFIIGNEAPGHIRTWDYSHVSYRGAGTDGVFDPVLDPNGVDRGVAISEFEFENGATRPVQVGRNLTLNNGVEPATGAMLSSRLVLTLDEAPSVDGGGVPINLGLFDVNFDTGFGDNGGVINGFGDTNNDAVVNSADQIFANADGSALYPEGSTVSAVFGNTRYDWSISYTGEITWTDADNSVVAAINGPGSSNDVVLIGLGSEVLQANFPGDANGDGKVDLLDLDILGANFGLTSGATNGQGDFNGDTAVDLLDLDILGANFGNMQMTGVSVPEPTGCVLLVAGLAGLLRRRG